MKQVEKSTESIATSSRIGDVEAAAKLLGVPKSWIYDRTRRNAIPMFRLGKYVRFDLDQLLKWMRSGCPGTEAAGDARSND